MWLFKKFFYHITFQFIFFFKLWWFILQLNFRKTTLASSCDLPPWRVTSWSLTPSFYENFAVLQRQQNTTNRLDYQLMKTIRWTAVKSLKPQFVRVMYMTQIHLVYVLLMILPVCFVLPANSIHTHYRAKRWGSTLNSMNCLFLFAMTHKTSYSLSFSVNTICLFWALRFALILMHIQLQRQAGAVNKVHKNIPDKQ